VVLGAVAQADTQKGTPMSRHPYRVVMPLPDRDFDTTEAAVSWLTFVQSGCEVTFATEHGRVAQCDPHLLSTGWLNPLPAGEQAVAAYREMIATPRFRSPISYSDMDAADFEAVHLSGGHSKGMRQYLDSNVLQQKIVQFVRADRLIGAICHGVLIPARAIDPRTGRSVLDGRTATTLTLPLEKWAFRTTFFRVGRRYRTYWRYTETEVRRAVGDAGTVLRGESWTEPFVVDDGQFVTGRYPLDVPLYAETFVKKLAALPQES
jgi:putative intracellular protease/amidase